MAPSIQPTLPERPSTTADYWHRSGFTGVLVRATLRTLQLIFAVIVAALYGVDLHLATKAFFPAHASWIYAEVAAALSILTCIAHCFATITRVAWVTWDFVLCILWTAQFGYFASMYLGPQADGGDEYGATGSIQRMKAAVWIDLVNMLLWMTSFVQGIVWCCTARRLVRGNTRPVHNLEGGREPAMSDIEEAKPLASFDTENRTSKDEQHNLEKASSKGSLPSYRQALKG